MRPGEYLGATVDPFLSLIAQVNRFAKTQGVSPLLLHVGYYGLAAKRALQIVTLRLKDGIGRGEFPEPSAQIQLLAEIGQYTDRPTEYVTPRLEEVTQIVGLYANKLGLPPGELPFERKAQEPSLIYTPKPPGKVPWTKSQWASAIALAFAGGVGAFALYRSQVGRGV